MGEQASKVGQPTPFFPLNKIIPPENRLVNHLNSTELPYMDKTGWGRKNRNSITLPVSPKANPFPPGICLVTLLLHSWEDEAYHLTKSLINIHVLATFLKESTGRLQWWELLCLDTESLTTLHPSDRKSAAFLLEVWDLSHVVAPRAAEKKTQNGVFWTRKRCWGECFHRDTCSPPHVCYLH